MLIFEGVYARGKRLGGVVGQEVDGGLKDIGAVVIPLGYVVYGYARLLVAGLYDGTVHTVAIHALAAVRGKKRRVYVDYATTVCLDNL